MAVAVIVGQIFPRQPAGMNGRVEWSVSALAIRSVTSSLVVRQSSVTLIGFLLEQLNEYIRSILQTE
jgi:hypothetical protein